MPELEINNRVVSFEEGETILEAAKKNDIIIPTLCYLAGASPTGRCRICLVQVEGSDRLLTACDTPAGEDMKILTESFTVKTARKTNLEMLIASGAHNCLVMDQSRDNWTDSQLKIMEQPWHNLMCPSYGDCRLQDLAIEYGVRVEGLELNYEGHPLDDETPMIVRDFSRCIGCGRCIQACNEVQVNMAIPVPHGPRKDHPAGWYPIADYENCTHCGECVQVCPTGALFEKKAFGRVTANEAKKERTTCPYCGVGCQLYLHVKDNRVLKVTGVKDIKPNFGSLCVKGRFGYDFVNHEGRLKTPLIKENGKFREAGWEEALDLVAEKLGSIKKSSGPDSIATLCSARITNEEDYLAQKFTRAVLSTNNIDHCARLCHASTVAGLAAAFGSGAMTNLIADIEKSDVILITGSNTTENHPVLSSFIKRAVKYNGTKLVVVDPRRIPITKFADVWLRQNLGTDVAWMNGMMHVIIKENLYDKAYVNSRTVGFDELKATVEKYTPEYVEEITGISKEGLAEAARLFANAKVASIFYSMGITQHTTGTDNVKSTANLAMLCGNVGIAGGGVNPLRGQNNVQGACDMGGLPNVYTGYQAVTDNSARERMEKAWGVGLPSEVGLTATTMMEKAHEGELKALYIIGENPMISDPDLNHTKKSLENLEFLVVQDIFLTETAELADVVLPSVSYAEKDGTFTNTERKVQRVRRAVNPPGQAKDDWEIICEISRRLGYQMQYSSPEEIMKEISRVTPSYRGINYDRIEDDGLHWPCPDTDHPGTPCLHVDKFSCGQGVFHANDYKPPAEMVDEEYPMYLTTGRVLYQYHTGTMTMKSEGLNELAPRSFVEISGEDADAYNISEGDILKVASRRGEIEAVARISEKAVSGTVFIPFHYAKGAANILTSAALDPVAKIPEYKVCAVSLSKIS